MPEYVRGHYGEPRRFLTAAAREGDTVLMWIS